MPAARTRTSDRIPASGERTSDHMPASRPNVDAPQFGDRMAAQRARESVQPETVPHARAFGRADSMSATTSAPAYNDFAGDHPTNALGPDDRGRDTAETPPLRSSLSEEELFGNDAAEVLRGVSAQLEAQQDAMVTRPAMPQHGLADIEPVTSPEMKPLSQPLPTVPVVRFSKSHSIPPANMSSSDAHRRPDLSSSDAHRHPDLSSSDAYRRPAPSPSGLQPVGPVMTKQGVGPASPVSVNRVAGSSNPPANTSATPYPPAAPKRRGWVLAVVCLLLAGATAAVVAVTMSGGEDPPSTGTAATDPTSAANLAPPVKATGTVKFVLTPNDAEIKLEGIVVHTGSPWTSELQAGIHQIEIHKQGYKSWLTSLELSAGETHSMRVVLEKITEGTAPEDATLTVATTPEGLDVFIDGQPFPGKTPIKTALKVGPHKIVVKQNGIEVWQQNVNAEAASDYEFNPSFTDAKKRERAQRASKPAAPAPAPAPTPTPAPPAEGSGSPAPAPAAGSAETAPAAPAEPAPAQAPARSGSGAAPPITTPL
jgi:hypothetical protein